MSNDTLAHHGIKGMRWGVRRYQNKDGGLTSAGRKRAAKLENEYSKLTGRKPGESSIKSTSSLRKKKIGEMSDDEIRAKIDRIVLEQRYNDLIKNPDSVKPLKQIIKGNTIAFMGQTGAGKSSIINCIDPSIERMVGEFSEALGRGKHMTKEVVLIPSNEGIVGLSVKSL